MLDPHLAAEKARSPTKVFRSRPAESFEIAFLDRCLAATNQVPWFLHTYIDLAAWL